MPRCFSQLYKYSFMYLKELFGILCCTESTCNKKLQHFWVSLFVTSLWSHNSKLTKCNQTFWKPYTWQFLKTYIGVQKLHQKDMEKFWEPEYFGKTLFSLWRFPRFLKMLYSVSDLLSELLALGNGSGNDRVFFSLTSRYLTLTWENNNFLLYWELMLYYFNKWFNTLLQEISFPQNYCLHCNLKKQL